MDEPPRELNQLTRTILGAAMAVHTALGAGFVESVYEEALCVELTALGIAFQRQLTIQLTYRECIVGTQRLDLVVEDCVVLELKAVEELGPTHVAQLLSYLRASMRPIGLLLNFNVPHLRNGIRRLIRPKR